MATARASQDDEPLWGTMRYQVSYRHRFSGDYLTGFRNVYVFPAVI